MDTLFETDFQDLNLVKKGKVRDVYEVDEFLLFVATDRISAFDVIMNEPIPYKGLILSQISAFWFNITNDIVKNHFITNNVDEYPNRCKDYRKELENRSMLVKKCKPLPIECIVRGYVAGSGWKEYKKNGTICGEKIPEGLVEYSKLPIPIFTPSTKEESGHDINISYEKAIEICGFEVASKLKNFSIDLYKFGADYLEQNGLILADTKFEFGLDENDEVILIDEALTPDSSRFWLIEEYAPGKLQVNFDKQVLRDYLESCGWDKNPPPPKLPENVLRLTTEKYKEAYSRILNKPIGK